MRHVAIWTFRLIAGLVVSASVVQPAAGESGYRKTLLQPGEYSSRLVAAALSQWEPLRIAIERPTGIVVDTLVEAGLHVVPIHPNVVKATRSRYSTNRAKSDPGDSYLLADLLRTDGHRFKTLMPLSDETKALRALVRVRDDVVAERVGIGRDDSLEPARVVGAEGHGPPAPTSHRARRRSAAPATSMRR